jgi:large subunit ribosomal protein L3
MRNVRGLLGTKLGMTQVWDANNRVVPVTVIAAGTNVVTQVRKVETDGYSAIQLGYGEIPGRKVTKPAGWPLREGGRDPSAAAGRDPHRRRRLVRARQELSPDLFTPVSRWTSRRTSKGKGFAGVMKRHGFHGVSASHGAHRNHRKPGSIGGCATPGRVFKGMKMAGRMGGETVTTQNLTVHAWTRRQGLLLIVGRRPGPRAAWSWCAVRSRPRRGSRHDQHRRAGCLRENSGTVDLAGRDLRLSRSSSR